MNGYSLLLCFEKIMAGDSWAWIAIHSEYT